MDEDDIDIERSVEIDTQWKDYLVALSPGWAKQFMDRIPNGSPLDQYAFDLIADLRSASLTASLPYRMISQLAAFHSGYVNAKNDPPPAVQIADSVVQRLTKKLDHRLDAATLAIINGACLEI